jgi:hypothetical protein
MAVLSSAEHKRHATIKATSKYPRGRFPMPDKEHARKALQLLPKAHGLSSGQKAKIRAKARRILGHSTPTTG